MSRLGSLQSTVIKNDYCIGCGACSVVNPAYTVAKDQYGMYKATLTDDDPATEDVALKVCPFSSHSRNETTIAEELYPLAGKEHHALGKYIECYVGHVLQEPYREMGSSGGFGKWILAQLVDGGHVDYVVQVVSTPVKESLFEYKIFSEANEINGGSRSAYYPVTLEGAINYIVEHPGRYAVTALPCFAKALRNLCATDARLEGRVKYVIGIVCGHLKSDGFAEALGWQLGVSPPDLHGIEFRGKVEGWRANDKGVTAVDGNGVYTETRSSKQLFGGDWGQGLFKYKACDYCDDIVGETCDVSVGDAWIPELMDDHKGNNILVVRNATIRRIIEQGIIDKNLKMTTIDEKVVVKSQLGGIRHRREGLAYRLYLKRKQGEWVPEKRVEPTNRIAVERKKVYRTRETLRIASHIAFLEAKAKGDFSHFTESIKPLINELELSFGMKVIRKLRRLLLSYRGSAN